MYTFSSPLVAFANAPKRSLVSKILRESTDGVEEYKFIDEEAVDNILRKKYPKEDGKFTPDAIDGLGIKTKDGDVPLDADALQKRAQEQYDKLREMQIN